jgi:hypothetical protein
VIPDITIETWWFSAARDLRMAMLLVITGSVASKFENLNGKVFEDGGEVNWGTDTNTLSIVALQKTVRRRWEDGGHNQRRIRH